MLLGGDCVAAISDDLVRIMSGVSKRDSAFRESDNGLFMGEMGRELSWRLPQQFIGHAPGWQLVLLAAHFPLGRMIVHNPT